VKNPWPDSAGIQGGKYRDPCIPNVNQALGRAMQTDRHWKKEKQAPGFAILEQDPIIWPALESLRIWPRPF